MRITLKLSFEQLILPINYNEIIQGFIYNHLSNETFRDFLHNQGFQYEKRKLKLFTFGRLEGAYKINKREKKISFQSPVYLTISSVVDPLINDFGNTLLNNKNKLFLGKNKVRIENLEVSNRNIDKNTMAINMLSPVVTYSTVDIRGYRKTIYHSPEEDLFNHFIYDNLQKKVAIIHGKEMEDKNFHIVHKKVYPVITKYKDFVIKGWLGQLEIYGMEEILQVAYDVGIGSKNSQGFGCFEIIS